MALQNAQMAAPGEGSGVTVKAGPGSNPFQIVGFLVLLGYLFVLYARIFDIAFGSLHIAGVLFVVAMAATILTGGLWRPLSHPIGFWFLLFLIWVAVTIPFSFWKGGSYQVFRHDTLVAFLVFTMTAALLGTFSQCKKAIATLAVAAVALAVLSLVFGSTETGRLFLPGGKFQNPNDLAQVLLVSLPCLLFVALDSSPGPLGKILPALGVIPVLAAMAQSGSRGALVSFLLVMALIFWRSSLAGKVMLALGAVVFVVAVTVYLPSATLRRYLRFFEEVTPDQNEVLAPGDLQLIAIASSESRHVILLQSLRMTLHHPLFGVGPGMFAAQQAADAETNGEKAHWLVTHNTYTQASSETGIPGFLFYVATIVCCFRTASSLEKRGKAMATPEGKSLERIAFCLRLSLAGFVATAMFSSNLFQSLFPTLAGMLIAFDRATAPARPALALRS